MNNKEKVQKLKDALLLAKMSISGRSSLETKISANGPSIHDVINDALDIEFDDASICGVCFTSSFEPCPESRPEAIPDGHGGFMVCSHCELEKSYVEAMKNTVMAMTEMHKERNLKEKYSDLSDGYLGFLMEIRETLDSDKNFKGMFTNTVKAIDEDVNKLQESVWKDDKNV
jgi:hypothetical protein